MQWGPGLQPRHVPWLGIEPATLWFAGQSLIRWATPTWAVVLLFMSRKDRGSILISVLRFVIPSPSSLCFTVSQWVSQLAHIYMLGIMGHQRKSKMWSLSFLSHLLGAKSGSVEYCRIWAEGERWPLNRIWVEGQDKGNILCLFYKSLPSLHILTFRYQGWNQYPTIQLLSLHWSNSPALFLVKEGGGCVQ